MTTEKLHVAVLPEASVTLKVFIDVPTGNAAPEANPVVCVVVAPAQLSAPTGAVNATTFEQRPGSLLPVIFAGQVIVGSSLSVMVTVKLQVAVLPTASVAVNVFVVMPARNVAPLASPDV